MVLKMRVSALGVLLQVRASCRASNIRISEEYALMATEVGS
jgi:hypothetical protein